MRSIVDDLKELGATLVAITPQLAEHSRDMVRKYKLPFDMLSDPGNDYAAELGMRFRIAQKVVDIYMERGLDIPGTNGEDSWTLPMPARLVIDRAGVVRAADIDADYTRRPEPEKTLADLDAL